MAENREIVSEKDSSIIFSQEGSVQNYTLTPSGIRVEFIQYGNENIQSDPDKIEFQRKGELGRISLSRNLLKNGDLLEIAPVTVEIITGRSGFSEADWNVRLDKPSDFVPSEHDKNVFINSNGEEVKIDKTVLREQREGKERSVLQIVEVHSPSGIIKAVKAPLNINIKEVERVFSQKSDSRLRDIRELVGVSLSW